MSDKENIDNIQKLLAKAKVEASFKTIADNLLITKALIAYAQAIDPTTPNESWYVGITNDPDGRKKQHEDKKNIVCKHFKSWDCGTEEDARLFEKILKGTGFAIDSKSLKKVAAESLTQGKKEEPSKFIYTYLAVDA